MGTIKRSKLSRRAANIDITNPHPRLAVCLCLDTSSSMLGHPIRELNSGIRLFYKTIWNNKESRYAADIAIVTFGDGGVQCIQDFAQLYEGINPPMLKADGTTPMGEAVNLALDMLEERRQLYWDSGIQHYHSRLIIMADGRPNGNVLELSRAAKRSRELDSKNRLLVIPVGVSKEADMNVLAQFSHKVRPMRLRGLDFSAFFKWLSVSVEEAAGTKPGYDDEIPLPEVNWAVTDGGWDTAGLL